MKVFMLAASMMTLIAAGPVPDAAALHAGLAGRWTGSLGYRDYQTDKMSEIAVKTEIRALPDGVTVLRISEFDDGPRVGAVFITTASLHDSKAGTVSSATLRKGNSVEIETETLAVTAYVDAAHWTIVAEADGSDDDKPARLRVTEVRDGLLLTATKDVQPKGTATWAFRNRTLLRKAE
ncbi:hypothetical protein GCM10011529_25520 [Polymorphobacter glacialis]|uniref:Lipocalin-like domain-containing protein n=1 Tax=Sandarakinorhabdus glacialis TaxID=1614636 RepID=A0A917E9Z4_9SPHN|nr:hypothetical protein [Polymorphobacter glacialis]GGE17902.1 hypothetical protein GCM10011529_25520 [Polymorphobacter glacialis]